MGFLDSLQAGIDEAKKSAAKMIPPTEDDVKKLNTSLSSSGISRAAVVLENFKETPEGNTMQRVSFVGSFANPDQEKSARKIAEDAVGSRWVSQNPLKTLLLKTPLLNCQNKK